MPPSPSSKCSPRREIKLDSKHRRGRSFDSGISLKAKDDDLTLFNEMQMRERDEFLLRPNDDFEESLSKLRCLPDYNLDINIPIRGESSDILNTDSGKNDYDWLLTPPDTPLFPSLDDDEPPSTNLSTGNKIGRNQRPARSSASPHRRSPSPRPGSISTLQSRGRTSSASNSGHSPALSSSASSSRRPSPSRRPTTPTSKPSTPTPRSVTPTLRRSGSSSNGWTSSSKIRGTSPVKGTRGASASPKLQRWQSDVPGFSSDVPPNLRTSVLDRPTSYSRGSSPASKIGKESYPRHDRESMSPTPSRSVSSWHSHDRDHFSSHSKGSIASSGDDDVESLQSVSSVGISFSPSAVKNGAIINNRTMTYSKRVSRTPSPSSVPKRSFDLTLRNMDNRKTPQNMFRPLMSSVPPSSFFGGKGSTLHRPIFSRNSSIATRSTASYELAANVNPNIQDIDHDHSYIDDERVKVSRVESCLHEEMSLFDKTEEAGVDANPNFFSIHDSIDVSSRKETELECQNSIPDLCEIVPDPSSKPSSVVDHPILDSDERISICSICRKIFQTKKMDPGDAELCQQCALKDMLSTEVLAKACQLSEEVEDSHSRMAHAVVVAREQPSLKVSVLELDSCEATQPARKPELTEGKPLEGIVAQLRTIGKESKVDREFDIQQTMESLRSISEYKFKSSSSFSPSSSLRSDGSEGTGLSVLLKRSSSTKGAVLQGRGFTAANIPLSESSDAKESPRTMHVYHSRNSSIASPLDLQNAMKLGYSRSSSTTSSLDLGSSRKMETHFQKQLSSRKHVTTSLRNDSNVETCDSGTLCIEDLQTNSQVGEIHELPCCYSGGEISSVNDECFRLIDDLDGSTLATKSVDTTGHEHDDYAMECSVVDVTLSESSICPQNSHLSAPMADSESDLASMLHEISETNQTNRENIKMETPVDISVAVGTADETTSFDTSTVESSMGRNEIEKIDGLDSLQLNSTKLQNPINDMESSHTQSASLMSEKKLNSTELQNPINDVESSHTRSASLMSEKKLNSSELQNPINDMESSHTRSASLMSEKKLDSTELQNPINDVESSHIRSASLMSEKNISVSLDELNNPDIQADKSIHEESTVTIENLGRKSRSLTLEEATDTILFCSKIIQDLANKAAGMGAEKEESFTSEVPRPTVTVLQKAVSDRKTQSRILTRPSSKSQKVNMKSSEPENTHITEPVTDVKDGESHSRQASHDIDMVKPKCSCIIM